MASVFAAVLCLAVAESLCAGNPGPAETEKARIHFEKGQRRFTSGDYLQAIEHFRISYEITGSPELMYNIARCYEEAGDREQAVAHYQLYLRVSDGGDRTEVEARIEWLEGRVDEPGDDGGLKQDEDAPDDADDEDDDDDDDDDRLGDPREKKKEGRLKGFAFDLRLGPGFVIIMPKSNVAIDRHHFFAVDLMGHFFLNDWFAVAAGLTFAGYMQAGVPIDGRDAKGHFGAGIGISMFKKVSPYVSLATKILAVPTAIKRADVSRRATWIDFQFSFGLLFHLPKNWSIVADAVADVGPAFVIRPDLNDWVPSLCLAAGARVGVSYRF